MPSPLDWDQHKDKILDLFVTQNKPLAEVQKYMFQRHEFNATYARPLALFRAAASITFRG